MRQCDMEMKKGAGHPDCRSRVAENVDSWNAGKGDGKTNKAFVVHG